MLVFINACHSACQRGTPGVFDFKDHAFRRWVEERRSFKSPEEVPAGDEGPLTEFSRRLFGLLEHYDYKASLGAMLQELGRIDADRQAIVDCKASLGALLRGLGRTDADRRALAEAIRHALDKFGQITLGPTDGELAADALDGIPPKKIADPQP